jgi:hypothetical protein
MDVQKTNRLAGVTRLAEQQTQKGGEASDDLFDTSCESTADASAYRRDRARFLLCSAAGFGAIKSRGIRRAHNDALIESSGRLNQRAFS